ncbi:hypothetical protein ED733_004842 [Metarhizium rileyi]|uniref:Uncharacterized protein n=1 Tax=Metarhizium rileyi (strain RCEF 4871) TaxID=1649241 RepID=A0A5C6GG13_METRR|nr:hypothetical protein ED733_004842 [Metarhizium rileyi]
MRSGDDDHHGSTVSFYSAFGIKHLAPNEPLELERDGNEAYEPPEESSGSLLPPLNNEFRQYQTYALNSCIITEEEEQGERNPFNTDNLDKLSVVNVQQQDSDPKPSRRTHARGQ